MGSAAASAGVPPKAAACPVAYRPRNPQATSLYHLRIPGQGERGFQPKVNIPSFEVLGEARNGEEALRLAHTLEADVLLLDLAMPGVDGLEAFRELGPTSPLRTLILTARIETEQIVQALQLGARGVVLKDAATEILFKSIRAVMNGEYWVGREKISNLVEALQSLSRPAAVTGRYGLTERERQVAAAIVEGLTNREIAAKLSIGLWRGAPL